MTSRDDPNRKEDSAHRHPSKSDDDTAGQYGGGEENAEGIGSDHDEERFSEGQEATGETTEKEEVGTFAEGQAVTPDDPDEDKEGEFSTGMEQRPHGAGHDVRREGDR